MLLYPFFHSFLYKNIKWFFIDHVCFLWYSLNGFQVQTVYDKKENSGSVTVFLTHEQTEGAFFNLLYAGISEKEAIGLAKKFDWKKIKSKIQSLR